LIATQAVGQVSGFTDITAIIVAKTRETGFEEMTMEATCA
jgi:hypothetical protein